MRTLFPLVNELVESVEGDDPGQFAGARRAAPVTLMMRLILAHLRTAWAGSARPSARSRS